jgi:hypothetical protein
LEDIGIPELILEQVEGLCEGAERAAREHILSQIPTNRIATLDVTIDTEGTKPLNVNVDVTVVLSPLMKDFNVEVLTEEATKKAFAYVEEYLRELACKSTKYSP